jgi:hypothetical protein
MEVVAMALERLNGLLAKAGIDPDSGLPDRAVCAECGNDLVMFGARCPDCHWRWVEMKWNEAKARTPKGGL